MGKSMKEVLEFIFSSGWVFFGTIFLIYSIGYSLAIPFMWYYKMKQQKMNKSVWNHPEN
tara:strand:- start:1278 stop:1454 length:177 start_codon:yes stop_codon:yes gene_type:complete